MIQLRDYCADLRVNFTVYLVHKQKLLWLDLFRINPIIFLLLLSNSLLFSVAYGDGLASETLPPAMIGNKNVTLSIGSSPFLIDYTHVGTEINFALLDVDTQENLPQVTLAVSVFSGEKSLFGHIFKSDNGNFLLDIIPQQSGNVSISEEGGVLSGIAGQHSGNYNIKSPDFNSGGLYRFKIEVLTMGSYDNQVSKTYNAAISIPVTYIYDIYDKQYGKQNVTLIASPAKPCTILRAIRLLNPHRKARLTSIQVEIKVQ